jgi:hypothetical protein
MQELGNARSTHYSQDRVKTEGKSMKTVHNHPQAFGMTILLASWTWVVSAFVVPEQPPLPDFDQRYQNAGRALVLGSEREAKIR